MNRDIAQRIIDEKPAEGQHLYIDTNNQPRDKHIENLFRDLFAGVPLDDIFRNNFEVYFQQLVNDKAKPVFRGIFIDAASARRWIADNIGVVTVSELSLKERAKLTGGDPELAPMRYVAKITSPYAKRLPPAYAPSELHATLLAAVFVFRAEAGKRLKKFFAPAIRG